MFVPPNNFSSFCRVSVTTLANRLVKQVVDYKRMPENFLATR